MNFLDVPAYKVEVRDLQKAQPPENVESDWMLTLTSKDLGSPFNGESANPHPPMEKQIRLSLLWVQGTVVNTEPEQPGVSSVLRIRDSTGEALIYDFHTVPGGNHPGITEGNYVGVIGQLASNTPNVIVKGAKIMHLQSNPCLKAMWSDEITADRAFLLGMIEPELFM